MKQVKVFAPASVGNACVGFDVLGFSFDAVGDTVNLRKIDKPEVHIKKVSDPRIPLDPQLNTATVGLLELITSRDLKFGFELDIEKGIPMCSGMGGSAASAVAAAFGANLLLPKPLSELEVMKIALSGEKVASGSVHGDNVAPSLFGGLMGTLSTHPLDVFRIPLPSGIFCLLVHPHLEISTSESRKGLRKDLLLSEHVLASAHLAAFVSACHTGDYDLLSKSMWDILIEPQRERSIPNFRRAKQAALRAGTLGFSISGSGPSVFAWFKDKKQALTAQRDLMVIFDEMDVKVDSWIQALNQEGARRVS